ncbi:ABC-2 type transport system permease protein [Oikeobacillus pervagus]|uniref:ABC-2 type transport system permease protein n=1 Tax=Oikeobacillus pervagus TaxID=1325931 RepID=A0AAJ1T6J6_9BACI|nr:ABC transporter permease [Oikeobacillus pervagus]MDQ0216096.1 ABC-2 type transport system permease protein [Oikeobacillus pervagus]
MIGSLIKKQCLILLRNRDQLFLLLVMPLILISILGFSLGSMMAGDTPSVKAKVVLINHGDEAKEIEQFKREVEQSNRANNEKEPMIQGAEYIRPIRVLTEEVFGDKELKKHLKLVKKPPSELEKLKKSDHYAAIIEVPEKFTYHIVQNFMLGKEVPTGLTLYQNEGNELSTKIIEDVLINYQKQYSTFMTIEKAGLMDDSFLENIPSPKGETDTVTKRKPLNAMMYYAVGMSVMFVLFVASSIGSFAFKEKQQHVFNRILLTNVSSWSYFTGVFLSGMILAFIQLIMIFSVTATAYDVKFPSIIAFVVVCIAISFAIGGLSVLLTALSYRFNSEMIINFFANALVSIFAFLGGSFFPVGGLSNFIQYLGNLTPNGAGMTAFLKLLQGYELQDISEPLLYLAIMGVATIMIAIVSFPKRGEMI